LNDLPEFTGLNPSLEAFSRILCISLGKSLRFDTVSALKVVLLRDYARITE
jgi:6-pyruvoyltetrahydropterin/6-carboxytetrahydropterin synthase